MERDMPNYLTFEVCRTSIWDDDTPPVPNARRGATIHVDRRTFKTPDEFDARFGHNGTWASRGRDHGRYRDGIYRVIDGEGWLVDVPDLIAFAQEHGEIIVDAEHVAHGGLPKLEIYDGYRE